MSELHIRHIRNAIIESVGEYLSLNESSSRDELSKGLAAYTLSCLSGITPDQAVHSITDGGDDNGIDAIYADLDNSTLHLVQSKWAANGAGGWAQEDVQSVVRGTKDILNGRFDRFNDKFQEFNNEIGQLLDKTDTRIAIYLTSTMTTQLAEHPRRILDDFHRSVNDISEITSHRLLNQGDLHRLVANAGRDTPISLDVVLHEWGRISDPYEAFYGQVSATEVARWFNDYGTQLFDRNIRSVIDRSLVNDAIASTVAERPESFWYFNNGIVMLADNVNKTLHHGEDRATGTFRCQRVSIVNGAQTVSAIARGINQLATQTSPAKILVRIISLDNCPDDFATDITRATNTQNRIGRQDFVALDPEQDRLRTELRLDGKIYAIRTGENVPRGEDGCSIVEATVALACADGDIALCVQAKREIGKLWEDTHSTPYRRLFNPATTSQKLWRSVEIMRMVDHELSSNNPDWGHEHLVFSHGNRFVLHCVYRSIGDHYYDCTTEEFSIITGQIPQLVQRISNSMLIRLASTFHGTYPAPFFKNNNKCTELANLIIESDDPNESSDGTLFD